LTAFAGWIPHGGTSRELETVAHRLNVRCGVVVTSVRADSKSESPVLVSAVRLKPYAKQQRQQAPSRPTEAKPKTEQNESLLQQLQLDSDSAETLLAKRVIVTVSVGVLRSGLISFDPELPLSKRNCFESRVAMGVVNKLILRFREVMWPDDTDFLGATADSRVSALFFSPVRIYPKIPVVVAFIGGSLAESMEKKETGELREYVVEPVLRALVQMLCLSKRDSRKMELISFRLSRWKHNPFTRGSHSYLTVDSDGRECTALEEPIANGRILFAGEATNSSNPGSLLGALSSGVRAAHRVLGKPLDTIEYAALVRTMFCFQPK